MNKKPAMLMLLVGKKLVKVVAQDARKVHSWNEQNDFVCDGIKDESRVSW